MKSLWILASWCLTISNILDITFGAENNPASSSLKQTQHNGVVPDKHKPTVCKYLITFKYTCNVWKKCNDTDVEYSCVETIQGNWSNADDIVHYYDVCIFTDHFTTCSFFHSSGTYECKMVWEQTVNPSGNFTGNAFIGFHRVGMTPLSKKTARRSDREIVNMRVRREGGGVC